MSTMCSAIMGTGANSTPPPSPPSSAWCPVQIHPVGWRYPSSTIRITVRPDESAQRAQLVHRESHDTPRAGEVLSVHSGDFTRCASPSLFQASKIVVDTTGLLETWPYSSLRRERLPKAEHVSNLATMGIAAEAPPRRLQHAHVFMSPHVHRASRNSIHRGRKWSIAPAKFSIARPPGPEKPCSSHPREAGYLGAVGGMPKRAGKLAVTVEVRKRPQAASCWEK